MMMAKKILFGAGLFTVVDAGNHVGDKSTLIQVQAVKNSKAFQYPACAIGTEEDIPNDKYWVKIYESAELADESVRPDLTCLGSVLSAQGFKYLKVRWGSLEKEFTESLDLTKLDHPGGNCTLYESARPGWGETKMCAGVEIGTGVYWHKPANNSIWRSNSWHFGIANTEKPDIACSRWGNRNLPDKHWGHFHVAIIGSSAEDRYSFGGYGEVCSRENENNELWSFWAGRDITTEAPTPAPTPDHASAYADPHCQNLKGERFDIRALGSMIMIKIPREAPPEEASFVVVGHIEGLSGARCGLTYLTQVEFLGSRLGAPPFSVKVGDGKPEVKDFILVEEMTAGKVVEVAPPHWLPENSKSWKRGNTTVSKYANGNDGVEGIDLQVASYVLQVTQHQDEKNDGTDFLNLDMYGIRSTGEAVGGLLGEDDHVEASAVPKECRTPAEMVAAMPRVGGVDTSSMGGRMIRLVSSLSAK